MATKGWHLDLLFIPQELDTNKDGTVTPIEFKEKMEQQKNYTT